VHAQGLVVLIAEHAAGGSVTDTEPAPTAGQLAGWIAQLDAVIDELHDDLVRRSIVHLRTLREDLQAAAQRRS